MLHPVGGGRWKGRPFQLLTPFPGRKGDEEKSVRVEEGKDGGGIEGCGGGAGGRAK